MKPAVLPLALAFMPLSTHADSSQAPASSATITVTRAGNGCDITLLPDASKTLTDQVWLVVDGKSEGFAGGNYHSITDGKSVHYVGNITSDLDGSVKDILKGQGFPVKASITTFLITFGINSPDSTHVSKTLHFRHENNSLVYTQFPAMATYKVGDKIPIFEAVALDSGISMRDALGPDNDFRTSKNALLPNDLIHRITIQVQFVPKTSGTP